MKFLICTVIYLLFCNLAYGLADRHQYKDKTYRLVLGPTPVFTPSITQGAGALLTHEITSRLNKQGYQFQIEMYPWARANHLFNSGKVDVLFPELIQDDSQEGMTGMPIYMIFQSIFTLKTQPRLHKLSLLKNKKVIVVHGIMKPQELLDMNLNPIELSSQVQSLNMLRARRADAFYGWVGIGDNNHKDIHYGRPIIKRFVAFRFQITKEGAKLMESFNQVMAEIIRDGTFNKIFKEYRPLKTLINQLSKEEK